jgi:hypothetical protein
MGYRNVDFNLGGLCLSIDSDGLQVASLQAGDDSRRFFNLHAKAL